MYNLYDRMAMLSNNEKKWIRSSYVYTLRSLEKKGANIDTDIIQQKIDTVSYTHLTLPTTPDV